MPLTLLNPSMRFFSAAAPVKQADGRWLGLCLCYLDGQQTDDYEYELTRGPDGRWEPVVATELDAQIREQILGAIRDALPSWKDLV